MAPGTRPREAWLALRAADGDRATMIDLYALVAAPRRLLANQLPAAERLELWRWAAPVIWPGFAVTQGSVRRNDPIEVVPYDPAWPDRFEHWRRRIADRIGEVATAIEHVGSTAVPGLWAKPRIDIQVSVANLSAEERYVPGIEAAGAQLRSRDDQHRYFRSFPGGPRVLQVHVCAAGSGWEADHLLFREYLRSHPAERDHYATVKRENAAVWADDAIGYTDAKSEVVLDILDRARVWDAAGR